MIKPQGPMIYTVYKGSNTIPYIWISRIWYYLKWRNK